MKITISGHTIVIEQNEIKDEKPELVIIPPHCPKCNRPMEEINRTMHTPSFANSTAVPYVKPTGEIKEFYCKKCKLTKQMIVPHVEK